VRLWPKPIEAAVESSEDGSPRRFRLAGRSCSIVACLGPERIETGWWRGASVRRDYFRIESDDGRRWWLFRRLDDGRWFFHGEFD
jgi:protein ImuB